MAPADPQQLPDDIDALKAMIAAAHAELAELKVINATTDGRIARLTSIVAMLQRANHGTRSERLRHDRLNDEQMAFVFEISTERHFRNAADNTVVEFAQPKHEAGLLADRLDRHDSLETGLPLVREPADDLGRVLQIRLNQHHRVTGQLPEQKMRTTRRSDSPISGQVQ